MSAAAARRGPSPILAASSEAIGRVEPPGVGGGCGARHTFELEVSRARPDPAQPRRAFGAESMAALAGQMAAQGQLQPIVVRRDPERPGRWLIVAGERRWRAAASLGWASMSAVPHGGDHAGASLVENMAREDLTPMEVARGVRALSDARGGSQAEVGRSLGLSQARVSEILGVLRLPARLTDGADGAGVPMNVLVELSRMAPGPRLEALSERALQGRLTVRMVRDARAAEGGVPAPAAGRAAPTARAVAAFADRIAASLASRAGPATEAERAALTRLRDAADAALAG